MLESGAGVFGFNEGRPCCFEFIVFELAGVLVPAFQSGEGTEGAFLAPVGGGIIIEFGVLCKVLCDRVCHLGYYNVSPSTKAHTNDVLNVKTGQISNFWMVPKDMISSLFYD